MQLEKMIPHTEGNYERRVFSDVADAISWMEKCGFRVETEGFIENIVNRLD